MIVDDLLDQVRLTVNDNTLPEKNAAPTFSDQDIVTNATQQMQSLTRVQIEKTRGFCNATVALNPTLARQVYLNCWQFSMPTWLSSVVRVWRRAQASASEPNFSPYVWDASLLPIQQVEAIPKKRPDSNTGYTWDGVRTLRVYGESVAPSLVLDIAKLPPPLLKANVFASNVLADRTWLPDTPTLGKVPTEEGALINAEFQVTKAANVANYGLLRRVVYSTSTDVTAGPRRNLVYFESGFPAALSATDTVQSVLPIGDEHARVVVLRTAHALFTKTQNIPGQQAIAQELRLELDAFARFADRKDYDGPEFYRPRESTGSSRITDRASSFGGLVL